MKQNAVKKWHYVSYYTKVNSCRGIGKWFIDILVEYGQASKNKRNGRTCGKFVATLDVGTSEAKLGQHKRVLTYQQRYKPLLLFTSKFFFVFAPL